MTEEEGEKKSTLYGLRRCPLQGGGNQETCWGGGKKSGLGAGVIEERIYIRDHKKERGGQEEISMSLTSACAQGVLIQAEGGELSPRNDRVAVKGNAFLRLILGKVREKRAYLSDPGSRSRWKEEVPNYQDTEVLSLRGNKVIRLRIL